MPHGSVLRIEPVRSKDKDQVFACIATNDIGQPARSQAHLSVYPYKKDKDFPQGYPRITVNPVLKSVEKDKNALLACEAEGDNVKIEWYKDKVPLDVSNNGRLNILPGGTLQIQGSQESDNGRYECVAQNDVGVDYSYAAMLYVKVRLVPPHFSKLREPVVIEVSPGDTVNMTCVAVGSPMPQVRWRDGANDMGPSAIGINVLVLEDVRESKNYTCVASSDLGNIEKVRGVVVRGKYHLYLVGRGRGLVVRG
ncbi:hypothetical protein FSP39_008274 [Pinctada imbricata]|uniref:protein-tyrosine-phosphatase n=1 Tax=Pinctada imbricata TaxID=66713 RepID=A0AA88XT53_PINIB|nr:hypothetical protein FSP39_008274 [Pinctada imbricata]